MPNKSMLKIGSICSVTSGIVFLLSGLSFFIFQVGRFDWNSMKSINDYFSSFPFAAASWTTINIGAAIASFLAVAGVLSLADILKPNNEGIVRWTSTLAIVGYAVIAVTNIADLYKIKHIMAGYTNADTSVRNALEVTGIGSLDPTFIIRFLAIGPWFLSSGVLSFKNDQIPKSLSVFGIMAGAVALIFVVISIIELPIISMITGSTAVIAHPIWLLWTGIVIGKVKY